MSPSEADTEPLTLAHDAPSPAERWAGSACVIGGRAVDPRLLETRAIGRCRLDECMGRCCAGGVYIHTRQVEDILAHKDLIIPHLAPERQDPSLWFDNLIEPDEDYPEAGDCMGTNVVDDPSHPVGHTCIFLTNARCALQAASIAAGEHPWRFKPFYCALHPLGLEKGELALVEDSEIYKDGGNCQRARDDGMLIPIYQLFDVEAKLALGEDGYAELDKIARGQAT
jgi:Protein of unknown function (DUF3109)